MALTKGRHIGEEINAELGQAGFTRSPGGSLSLFPAFSEEKRRKSGLIGMGQDDASVKFSGLKNIPRDPSAGTDHTRAEISGADVMAGATGPSFAGTLAEDQHDSRESVMRDENLANFKRLQRRRATQMHLLDEQNGR